MKVRIALAALGIVVFASLAPSTEAAPYSKQLPTMTCSGGEPASPDAAGDATTQALPNDPTFRGSRSVFCGFGIPATVNLVTSRGNGFVYAVYQSVGGATYSQSMFRSCSSTLGCLLQARANANYSPYWRVIRFELYWTSSAYIDRAYCGI